MHKAFAALSGGWFALAELGVAIWGRQLHYTYQLQDLGLPCCLRMSRSSMLLYIIKARCGE